MSKSVESYSMLISCPSDVRDFIPQIEEAVGSFNRGFGEQNGVILTTKHWSKNARSSLEKGQSGQDILNQQLVDECDLLLCVFWTRFGTPTDKFQSGTEEEIMRKIEKKEPVICFFLDKPISPSKIDITQLTRVKDFQAKLESEKYGLYVLIENDNSLAIKLSDTLQSWFIKILKEKKVPSSDNRSYTQNNKKVLWVDDRPENNVYGRTILENIGIEVITALSTNQALDWLEHNDVAVIISDMGRKEGNREGYVLLDQLRKMGNQTPFIVFAGSREPEHVAEVLRHGGQGCTNAFDELLSMVSAIVLNTYSPYLNNSIIPVSNWPL